MNNKHPDNRDQPYVAPFIRRLMQDATEEEILEASENVREYFVLLYRIYLRQEAQREPSEKQSVVTELPENGDALIGLS